MGCPLAITNIACVKAAALPSSAGKQKLRIVMKKGLAHYNFALFDKVATLRPFCQIKSTCIDFLYSLFKRKRWVSIYVQRGSALGYVRLNANSVRKRLHMNWTDFNQLGRDITPLFTFTLPIRKLPVHQNGLLHITEKTTQDHLPKFLERFYALKRKNDTSTMYEEALFLCYNRNTHLISYMDRAKKKQTAWIHECRTLKSVITPQPDDKQHKTPSSSDIVERHEIDLASKATQPTRSALYKPSSKPKKTVTFEEREKEIEALPILGHIQAKDTLISSDRRYDIPLNEQDGYFQKQGGVEVSAEHLKSSPFIPHEMLGFIDEEGSSFVKVVSFDPLTENVVVKKAGASENVSVSYKEKETLFFRFSKSV